MCLSLPMVSYVKIKLTPWIFAVTSDLKLCFSFLGGWIAALPLSPCFLSFLSPLPPDCLMRLSSDIVNCLLPSCFC